MKFIRYKPSKIEKAEDRRGEVKGRKELFVNTIESFQLNPNLHQNAHTFSSIYYICLPKYNVTHKSNSGHYDFLRV